MATSLTAELRIEGRGSYTNPLDLSTPADSIILGSSQFTKPLLSITNGTGSGQCDLWFHDQRTVAATPASDNLDLAGSLTNPITGASLTFAKIKVILIHIPTPATGSWIKIGPRSVSNAWQGPWVDASDSTKVQDIFFLADLIDGLGAVTAGTADIFPIYNDGGAAVTYDILLMGTSA